MRFTRGALFGLALLAALSGARAGPTSAPARTVTLFYSHECPRCKQLLPVYAAFIKENQNAKVKWDGFDCKNKKVAGAAESTTKQECQNQSITTYPTLIVKDNDTVTERYECVEGEEKMTAKLHSLALSG